MADAQLSTSISSISERASEVAQSASADELYKLSRVAPSLEQSENATLEVAINTRAAAIAGTASAADLKKIGKAIGNMLEPQTTSISGEFIGAQSGHSGKFFSTNGTSKNWGGVTVGGLQQVQLSTIENDQTLVYNSVSGKFENSSRAFDIPEYSLTQNLPASGTTGEVVFDVQASQLKYWDGSEWKTAAVVAASSGGGSSSAATTLMVVGNQNSYYGASGIYVYDASDLSAQATKLTPAGIDSGDRFGLYVAANSEFIFSGAHQADSNKGAVYAYDVSDLTATPTKLTAHDGQGDDNFGKSMAASSDKLVVGAPEDDDKGNNSGSVYVFDTSDLSAQATKLTAFDGSANYLFGKTVAVSSNHIVVDSGVDNYTGSVYVFDVSDLSAQPTKFSGNGSDKFGISIAASSNHIVVGAYHDATAGTRSGAVYVYDASNLSAAPTKLTAYDAINYHNFGASVAASDNYIAVGTHEDKDVGDMGGAVYVYDANDLSAQPTKVTAFDGSDYDQFARTGSISINSDRLIVGSQTDDDVVNNSGSAYIFDLSDLSAAATKVTAHDAGSDYRFGSSVAMVQSAGSSSSSSSSSSSTPVDWSPLTLIQTAGKSVYDITSGTNGESDLAVDMTETHTVLGVDKAYSGYGAAYIIDTVSGNVTATINNPNPLTAGSFGRRNSVGTDGTHVVLGNRDQDQVYIYDITGTLLRTISGPDSGAMFGHSVKIDGDYIVVGGYNQDKAYICSTSTGAILHTLTNPNVYGSTPDQFGQVVDISGNFMVVSTVEEDAADGSNSGVAYVYTVDAGSLLHTFVNPNAHGTSALDNFGIDCALDGNYLVVGAFGESDAAVGSGSGKAYFYNVATGTLLHTIDNPNPDSGTEVDYMGWSVDVEGQTAIVSAWYETGAAGADSGKCYLYDVVSGNLLHTIEDPNVYSGGGTDDRFGSEVAIAGTFIAVSAKGEDHASQNNVGAIYVFKGE